MKTINNWKMRKITKEERAKIQKDRRESMIITLMGKNESLDVAGCRAMIALRALREEYATR